MKIVRGVEMHTLKQSSSNCLECMANVVSTEWRPPEGLDPNMREFICENEKCGHKFYKLIPASHKREVQYNLGL